MCRDCPLYALHHDPYYEEDTNNDLESLSEPLAPVQQAAAAETPRAPVQSASQRQPPNTSQKGTISATTSRNAREGEAGARNRERCKAGPPRRFRDE